MGSGKSSFSAALVEKGAECLAGDRLGHELLTEDPSLRRLLAEAFGGGILDRGGRVDRRALARRAFCSPGAARELNRIVHPPLVARLRERIAAHRGKGKGILVIDAALIPEWGMEPELDVLVHVTAAREDRIKHWCRTPGRSEEDFERRERCQLSEERKKRRAHIVVHNDGDKNELKGKAEILWDLLRKIEAGTLRLTERVEL
jgi:dephospho-CoA kinase